MTTDRPAAGIFWWPLWMPILWIIIILLISCYGNPVPENAIEVCVKSGKYPVYKSTAAGTVFYCVNENQKIN